MKIKLLEKYKCTEIQAYCTLCHTNIKNCYDVEIDGKKETIGKDCFDNILKGDREILDLNWLKIELDQKLYQFKNIYRKKI